jgi:hypothetical protein
VTYANADVVAELAKEAIANTDQSATPTIEKSIRHAEIKINGKLRRAKISIPSLPESRESLEDKDPLNNLLEAGDLYAAAFVLSTYYSGNDYTSPAVRDYRTDADELLDAYIEIIQEGYNKDDPDNPTDVKIPVGSLVRRY